MKDTFEEVLNRMQLRQSKLEELIQEQKADLETLKKPDMFDMKVVTVRKASELYGVSTTTLYSMITDGRLRRIEKLGKIYISLDDLEKIK